MWRSGSRTPHFPCTQRCAFWSRRSSGCIILWYVFPTSHSGAIWRNISRDACLHLAQIAVCLATEFQGGADAQSLGKRQCTGSTVDTA